MITKNDVINAPNDVYLNKCIQGAVPLINTFSLSDVNQYDAIVKRYQSEILSRISLLNTHLRLVLNNFAKSQKIYLGNLFNDIRDIRHTSTDVVSIGLLNNMISTMTTKLESIKSNIELTHYLYPGTLSIYSDANVESNINYTVERESSPMVFNYFEGRSVLHRTISLLQYFSQSKDVYVDQEESLDISHIDKICKAIDGFAQMIKSRIGINQEIEELKDYCLIAQKVYAQYNFTNRESIDLFLGRKYSTIKEDIIRALLAQL